MNEGSHCSICLGEYTSVGTHRVTSLKCGHLFGMECIEKWIGTYKRNYCPTCFAPCKKIHLRQIFATKVEAIDAGKEKEIIDKYIKECEMRKSLEMEVSKLKTHIDILKSSVKQSIALEKTSHSKIHMTFLKYCKIHFFPDDSLLEFDAVNQVVIITCRKNGNFGIFRYSLSDFSINSFITFKSIIRDLKISPFSDGLCLVAYGATVSLYNIYSGGIARTLSFDTEVSAVSFSPTNRDVVHVGDFAGWLYICNLISGEIIKIKICNENIHGIVVVEDVLYVASAMGIYMHTGKVHAESVFNKFESNVTGICTGITSDGENILAIFRDQEYSVTGVLLGKKHVVFNPEIKQFFRHNDKVFNGYVIMCDDLRQTLKVLDINTLQMVYSYIFKEEVVSFCGDSKILVVLTRRGVYVYTGG